jgi:hypothetical protein
MGEHITYIRTFLAIIISMNEIDFLYVKSDSWHKDYWKMMNLMRLCPLFGLNMILYRFSLFRKISFLPPHLKWIRERKLAMSTRWHSTYIREIFHIFEKFEIWNENNQRKNEKVRLEVSTYVSKIFHIFQKFEIWRIFFTPRKCTKRNAKNKTKRSHEWNKTNAKNEAKDCEKRNNKQLRM